MRPPIKNSPAVFVLGLCCLACASTAGEIPEGGSISKPKSLNGFVSNAQVPGLAIAEARFPADHARVFGVVENPASQGTVARQGHFDLLEEERLVPILVRIGLPSSSAAEADVQLTPEQMDFRLILQDGTTLQAVGAEDAVRSDAKLTDVLSDKALQHGFLKLSGGVKEGFLYFKLAPQKAYEYDDGKLVHVVDGVQRELDLSRSLLSFKLTRGGTATPFFIGVAR